jgi:curved DNA-binding protein CbpA
MSDDRRDHIRSYVERASAVLDQVDYYRLLNISSASNDEQIRAAYYKLAASLHPDVHGVDVDSVYRAKLTAVFSRVAEAYKVLSDSALRNRYDRELAKGSLRISMGVDVAKKGPDIETPAARKFFKLAKSAMVSGDYKSATMNLRFALQVEPDNELIKSELAKAEQGGT